jgi:hypothetical protein
MAHLTGTRALRLTWFRSRSELRSFTTKMSRSAFMPLSILATSSQSQEKVSATDNSARIPQRLPTVHFRQLWKNSTDVLSTPKRVVFLGYSLPEADLHAQFIFRRGLYNQIHVRLKADGTRHKLTGRAEVIIFNPAKDASDRIKRVGGPLALVFLATISARRLRAGSPNRF